MSDISIADDPATGSFSTEFLVDTAKHPIHRRLSDEYLGIVHTARKGLAEQSCALLRGFIPSGAMSAMHSEAAALESGAVHVEVSYNPYFAKVPDDVSEDHPLRRVASRTNGMVRGDKFPREGAIWALFKNDHLRTFVADCLGKSLLHTYRDPFGCMNINIQEPGSEFPWHFDNNDFTVSVVLQKPESGGVFEYVPDLRTLTDPCYDAVKRVLDGDRSKVVSLDLQPGDLQLFKGHCAMHRVTAPIGSINRYSLLLAYVEDREKMAPPIFSKNLWGEIHPLQIKAQDSRSMRAAAGA